MQIGALITDSTCSPVRRGTSGICLARSGFRAVNDYVGRPDLFGRPFKVRQANIAGGLAATAVLVMGEGSERTPICLIRHPPLVELQDRNPKSAELAESRLKPDERTTSGLVGSTCTGALASLRSPMAARPRFPGLLRR
jgi:dihydrofolate synthase / folylpolyglutamate synthase